MSWVALGSVALAGVFGIAGTILGQFLSQRWERERRDTDRRLALEAEVRERARTAAEGALDALEKLRELFRSSYAHQSNSANDEQVRRLAQRLRREALYFPDVEVQERLRLAADIFGRYSTVEHRHGDPPSVISWHTFNDLYATLGHVVRNEPDADLPPLSPKVTAYALALEDERQAQEDQEASRKSR
jgi:hypothetical protein